MYKVIKFFTDLHDNDHAYNVGDIFPHKGVTVTEARLAELAGSDNRQGQPLIVYVEDAPKAEEKPKAETPKKPAAKKPTAKKASAK